VRGYASRLLVECRESEEERPLSWAEEWALGAFAAWLCVCGFVYDVDIPPVSILYRVELCGTRHAC